MKSKGQSIIEYAIIILLVIGLIITLRGCIMGCAEGYYYNYQTYACQPGYRP